ncbi:MAG: UbiD family decarboxylase [Phycisphaeraceae bacterium]|nr:MAG: UbiD family decarboxylase [Phycisphaeraceae bacterium]
MKPTLRDFIEELDRAGELHRVRVPVSPMLEITEIADRVSKSPCARESASARAFDPDHAGFGGKALLFEHVEDCDFPLAINVFGSYRRMEMALGVDQSGGFEAIARRIASLTRPQPPSGLRDMIAKAREFLPLLRIPPRRVRRGVCQEVVKLSSRGEVDLTRLPLIKCWPLDGDPVAVGYDMTPEQSRTAAGKGRYITFAGMHTIHHDDRNAPKPASHNIGMYRAQLVDATHLVMHWHMHHDGAAHWRSWKRAGEKRMPIAICFGGESVLPYAATSPLPPGLSELLMAGFLNGRGIPLVRARTVPLWVPANSEIVIEGWVSTECGGIGWVPPRKASRDQGVEGSRESGSPSHQIATSPDDLGPGAAFEGPFGDHTGFYSLPDRYPIVEVTAVTHRREAIFPATIVGLPPQEDYAMGKATERIFLPLLRTLIHDIEDYHLPMFGCFHNGAFVKIRKQYPLQARRVMHAIWGAGQMAWTKMIVVVDDDVNVHDEQAVLRAMFEHCHFTRDAEMVNGPLDILDHAAPRLGAGTKIGFDATRRMTGEEVGGMGIEPPSRPAGGAKEVAQHLGADRAAVAPDFGLGRLVFLAAPKRGPGDGRRAIEQAWRVIPSPGAAFVVAVDAGTDLDNWERVFFLLCANADPGRDRVVELKEGRPTGRIGFDATTKLRGEAANGEPTRDYPPILDMDAAIRQRVEQRWREYGFTR